MDTKLNMFVKILASILLLQAIAVQAQNWCDPAYCGDRQHVACNNNGVRLTHYVQQFIKKSFNFVAICSSLCEPRQRPHHPSSD